LPHRSEVISMSVANMCQIGSNIEIKLLILITINSKYRKNQNVMIPNLPLWSKLHGKMRG